MEMNKIKVLIAGGVSTFFSFFGILAIPLLLLVLSNILDWFSGIAASKVKQVKITSDRSYIGILKKVSMYVLILVGFVVDMLIGFLSTQMGWAFIFPNIVACMIAIWLILNEVISITENIDVLGINIPFLNPIIKLIKEKVEESVKVEEKR